MQLTKRIAITAGALTLGAAGVAAAAVTTPEEAEPGLTTAAEKAGFEVPVGEGAPEGEPATETEVETEGEGIGPVGNHGAEVSAVAHMDFETGREHGEAVSTIARSNGGGEAATAAQAADDAGDGDSDDDTDDGTAADQAKLGAGNAGDHGRP